MMFQTLKIVLWALSVSVPLLIIAAVFCLRMGMMGSMQGSDGYTLLGLAGFVIGLHAVSHLSVNGLRRLTKAGMGQQLPDSTSFRQISRKDGSFEELFGQGISTGHAFFDAVIVYSVCVYGWWLGIFVALSIRFEEDTLLESAFLLLVMAGLCFLQTAIAGSHHCARIEWNSPALRPCNGSFPSHLMPPSGDISRHRHPIELLSGLAGRGA